MDNVFCKSFGGRRSVKYYCNILYQGPTIQLDYLIFVKPNSSVSNIQLNHVFAYSKSSVSKCSIELRFCLLQIQCQQIFSWTRFLLTPNTVSANIQFTYTADYPDSAPEMEIAESENMDDSQSDSLMDFMKSQVKQKKKSQPLSFPLYTFFFLCFKIAAFVTFHSSTVW